VTLFRPASIWRRENSEASLERDAQPGSLEASVPNASATDNFELRAKLENVGGRGR
jgi:hypothetical protein